MPYFSLYFDLRPIVTFHVLLHLCGFQRTSELMHLCVNIQLQICHKKTKNSPNPVRGDFEGSKILISENHSISWTQAFSALPTSYFFSFLHSNSQAVLWWQKICHDITNLPTATVPQTASWIAFWCRQVGNGYEGWERAKMLMLWSNPSLKQPQRRHQAAFHQWKWFCHCFLSL